MKTTIALLSLIVILVSCSKRAEPPAPVSYGSGAPVTVVAPRPEIAPPLQVEQIIVVQQGENIRSISERYGIQQAEIIARNKLLPPYHIFPGQNLKLPEGVTPKPRPLLEASSDEMSEDIESPQEKAPLPGTGSDTVFEKEDDILPLQKPKRKKRSIAEREKELEDKFSSLEEITPPSGKKKKQEQEKRVEEVKKKGAVKKTTSLDEETEEEEKPSPAKQVEQPEKPSGHSGKFRWPLKGKILSHFSQGDGKMKNDGINIAAPRDTPIVAAENGIVVYEGNEMQGFGNLVLLKHPGGWMSAYGHCAKIFVKRGQTVNQGDRIALVGDTGNVRSSQLHFELRKKSTVVDPLQYLE